MRITIITLLGSTLFRHQSIHQCGSNVGMNRVPNCSAKRWKIDGDEAQHICYDSAVFLVSLGRALLKA